MEITPKTFQKTYNDSGIENVADHRHSVKDIPPLMERPEQAEMQRLKAKMMAFGLKPIEQKILTLKYHSTRNLTQEDIAKAVMIGQGAVSKILKKIHRKLEGKINRRNKRLTEPCECGQNRWKTVSKYKSWMCRNCGKVRGINTKTPQ